MPEISRFLGIAIALHYDGHPPPHFHAKYGEYEITVDLQSGVVRGNSRAGGLRMSWSGTNFIRKS